METLPLNTSGFLKGPRIPDLFVQSFGNGSAGIVDSPIQRLPVEILCEIFYYCSATECRYDLEGSSDLDYINKYGDETGYEPEFREAYQLVPRWLAILLVCRDWYHIAVDCPELWTRIDFSSRRLTELSLERSKSRPLDVVAFLPQYPDLTSLRLVMTHFHRIRRLLLFAWNPDDLVSILKGHRDDSADALEELTLHSDFFTPDEEYDPPWYRSMILHNVLKGSMPRLWSLHIAGDNILHERPTPVLHPGLRHLKLKDCRSFCGDWTLRVFLEKLEELPYLESLALKNAIPLEDVEYGYPRQEPDEAPTHVLQLPDSLTEFDIFDEVAAIDRLLDYISIPLWTTLRLQVVLGGFWERTRQLRLQKLRSICCKIPTHDQAPWNVLEVNSVLHMTGWNGYVRHSLDRDDLGHCHFDLQFSSGDLDEDEAAYAQYACYVTEGLGIKETACIIFDHPEYLDEVQFYCIFKPAENLQEISISSHALEQVLNMLGKDWQEPVAMDDEWGPFPPPGALWPALEAITIQTSHRHLLANWSLLIWALANRCRWDISIQSVFIVVDDLSYDQVVFYEEELRRFVPEVAIHVSCDQEDAA